MILHTEPSLRIYFGDAKNQLYQEEYLTWHDNLLNRPQYQSLAPLKLEGLYFLEQVHGVEGKIVDRENCDMPFTQMGDYLITQEPNLGIGVMTADCIPLVIYDKKSHVVAIVHAGWRGAVKGVALEAIKTMQTNYDTRLEDFKCFIGPSAKKCCYQVDDQFGKNLEEYVFGTNYIHQKPTGSYFDLPGFLVEQLKRSIGIKEEAIQLNYNSCTICNPTFWSHRRDTKNGACEKRGRQMTVVCLN